MLRPSSGRRRLAALLALPGNFRPDAEQLLTDSAPGVRQAAVKTRESRDPATASTELERLLLDANVSTRVAAARCASERNDFRPSLELVRSLLSVEGPGASEARSAAALLAVRLPPPESIPLLQDLMKNRDRQILRVRSRARGRRCWPHGAALGADIHAGESPPEGRCSRDPVQYGARITGTLGYVLRDPQRELSLRHEIPWILARIPTERSAEILVDNLCVGDPMLKYRVVKALNRLR